MHQLLIVGVLLAEDFLVSYHACSPLPEKVKTKCIDFSSSSVSNKKAHRIVGGSLSLLVWGCSRNTEDVLLHVAGKVSLGSLLINSLILKLDQ